MRALNCVAIHPIGFLLKTTNVNLMVELEEIPNFVPIHPVVVEIFHRISKNFDHHL